MAKVKVAARRDRHMAKAITIPEYKRNFTLFACPVCGHTRCFPLDTEMALPPYCNHGDIMYEMVEVELPTGDAIRVIGMGQRRKGDPI